MHWHLLHWSGSGPATKNNTDYKILVKVLATRLQDVVDEIIEADQSGYIKNRYIGDNIRTISDILEYSKLVETSGVIALLDFEKAFDTVRWEFLYNTMERMNFGITLLAGSKLSTPTFEAVVQIMDICPHRLIQPVAFAKGVLSVHCCLFPV